jgi:hypothetical protein
MVQLEELEEDGPPALEKVSGTESFAQIKGCAECDGLHIASEVAADVLKSQSIHHVLFFGSPPDGFSDFEHTSHVYHRADNGALITRLRVACDFIKDALESERKVAVVSAEEGEAGAGFLAAAFLILDKKMSTEASVDSVVRARPLNGLKDHAEFMKNLRFLGRNGIPDWA